jgi:hypothetical protein
MQPGTSLDWKLATMTLGPELVSLMASRSPDECPLGPSSPKTGDRVR